MAETEFELWRTVDGRQKSHLVNVLHWFHYRPLRLLASWKQEEVLTWELIRALEILPQRFFVRHLLELLGTSGSTAVSAARHLLQASAVEITPYPSLELRGGKRNCRSDIGLGLLHQRPNVWIEAKTARFSTAKLREQLDQQASAMASLLHGTPHVLVTLLPAHRRIADYPNLSWETVAEVLQSCIRGLEHLVPDEDLRRGYVRIAKELVDRIESHPNRDKGWI
jgi:hypothetical protein